MNPADPNAARMTDRRQLNEVAGRLVSWCLSREQLASVELLLNGGFAPLSGFMCEADYRSVLQDATLRDGNFWPVPVVLEVDRQFAVAVSTGVRIALREAEGVLLAVMTVEDVYLPDTVAEVTRFGKALGSEDGVLLGGTLLEAQLPVHYDFYHLRPVPKQLLEWSSRDGLTRVIGVQIRGFLHRREFVQTLRAANRSGAQLLFNPAVGGHSIDDPWHYAWIRSYEELVKHFPREVARLALCPLYLKGLGVWDLLLQAVVQKNCGCTHFMIQGESGEEEGAPFLEMEARIRDEFQSSLPISLISSEFLLYSSVRQTYVPVSEAGASVDRAGEEATGLRLNQGFDVPGWYSFPEVVREVNRVRRSRSSQGITIFFTGLSGSGKSTIANILLVRLMETGIRLVTLLDGDLVRQHLSGDLGFSREDRDTNIRRIGYVASEITRHGGLVICAPIAPYAASRHYVRNMISACGGFIEIYVNTPLEECERRDRKGLYARARQGLIREFTGVSDPYEVPENPELTLDTLSLSAEEAAGKVMHKLVQSGYIALDHV